MNKIKRDIDFEIIWRKLNSSLTPDEEKAFREWLDENRKHEAYFNSLRNYYQNGSSFDKVPVDLPGAWRRTVKKMDRPRKRKYIVAAVASISLLVSIYSLFPDVFSSKPKQVVSLHMEPGVDKATLILNDGSSHELVEGKELLVEEGSSVIRSKGKEIEYMQNKPVQEKVIYNSLKVPRGGEFFLVLSDSTKVWLNSETTLRYPVNFAGKERKVVLIGEAYFDVKRDELHPFKVESGNQVVEVLGTEFNISSYRDEPFILTTLVEGKVEVSSGDYKKVELTPGNQSIFDRESSSIAKQLVDTQRYTAWKDGRFYFQQESLDHMMKILSRWYDVDIVFRNDADKRIRFTGNLKRYQNLDKILSLLEKTHEIKFTANEKNIIVN